MAGYIGSKAVLISTTAATVTGAADIGGDLTVDTNTLHVDSTNNRVGIGTSSPASALDVTGTVTADGLTVDGAATLSGQLRFNDTNYWIDNSGGTDISYRSGGTHQFYSGGFTQRLNIASNGDISFYEDTGTTPKFFWDASAERLGIGTSSPNAHLHISKVSALVNLEGSVDAKLGLLYAGAEHGFMYANVNSVITGSTTNIPYSIRTNNTERMRIDSSGNVGIGTSSPQDPLHVAGDIRTDNAGYIVSETSTGGAVRMLGINAGNNAYVGPIDSGPTFTIFNASSTANTAAFYTGGTERMRIDSSGNLLVGTTSTPSNVALGDSTHAGLAYETGNYLAINRAGASAKIYVNSSGSSGTATQIKFTYNTAAVGTITSTSTSTSYNTSSDYRLKEDVQPMTGASQRVLALNPVNFAWKADGTRVDGFLAHEAQAVVPEAVTGTKDAMRTEEYEVTPAVEATYDEDGNELTPYVPAVMGTREVPEYQGIDQSKLVPLLTAALQEALGEITELKARVAALEAV